MNKDWNRYKHIHKCWEKSLSAPKGTMITPVASSTHIFCRTGVMSAKGGKA